MSSWRIGMISVGLVVVLAACDSGEAVSGVEGSQAVATTDVRAVKSYRFEPVQIRVSAGSTVTWSNEDNFVHDVRLLDGSDTTKALPVGGSASIRFDSPGRVRYECSLHPAQMKGNVLVD